MTARILVVDDLPANVKVLDAKLTAEYFTVVTAMNGADALKLAVSEAPDIILLDVMMPEMDGFEVCRRLKTDPATNHIPVVMVTALSDVADRVTGLEAGADDFLTKPVNDVTLFARIRSLARMKRTMDEWRMREETCDQFGVMPGMSGIEDDAQFMGRILVVEPDEFYGERLSSTLKEQGHVVDYVQNAEEAIKAVNDASYDLLITSLYLDNGDGLRLTSVLRAMEKSRTLPVLLIIESDEIGGLAKGFELGINDYLVRPVDANELKARTRTQLCQKRYRERLNDNYQRSLSLALTDDLTGLHNHRYLKAHMGTVLSRSVDSNKQVSLLMLDIDFFKTVNDTYGHPAGDAVLKELAQRIVRNLREFDMAARLGGEEFVIVMPECEPEIAHRVAERLRFIIDGKPFDVGADDGPLHITASIGVAWTKGAETTADELLAAADKALYMAKGAGRNQVVAPGLSRPLKMASSP
ncbi:MAG: two-component system cell cycle response regulator [Alphaproteobacteria bacterium]|jgi:two-component system cell cycle response regulator